MVDNFFERREPEKTAIELPAEFKNINAFFYEYIKHISLGGTFINTSDFMPVGTVFKFIIRVPKYNFEIVLNAEVVWVREKEEISGTDILPQGMGIKFVFNSEEEERIFREKIESLMKKELGERLTERLLSQKRWDMS